MEEKNSDRLKFRGGASIALPEPSLRYIPPVTTPLTILIRNHVNALQYHNCVNNMRSCNAPRIWTSPTCCCNPTHSDISDDAGTTATTSTDCRPCQNHRQNSCHWTPNNVHDANSNQCSHQHLTLGIISFTDGVGVTTSDFSILGSGIKKLVIPKSRDWDATNPRIRIGENGRDPRYWDCNH